MIALAFSVAALVAVCVWWWKTLPDYPALGEAYRDENKNSYSDPL